MPVTINNRERTTLADSTKPNSYDAAIDNKGPESFGKRSSSTTFSSGYLVFWTDATAASDDVDNPLNGTDAECIPWNVPDHFNGYLSLRFTRTPANAESGPTFPAPRVFVKYAGSSYYHQIPDVSGSFTSAFSATGEAAYTGTTRVSTEIHFDLRGAEAVIVLNATAYAPGSAGTPTLAQIEGRFSTLL